MVIRKLPGFAAFTCGAAAVCAAGLVVAQSDPWTARLNPSGEICFAVEGDSGDFAILNITMVEASGPGHAVVRPSDQAGGAASISHVNFDGGGAYPNMAIVRIGPDHRVCVANSPHSQVHAVVDQLGVLDSTVVTEVHRRVLDTRKQVPRYSPETVCLKPGATTTIDLVNGSSTDVEFARWAILTDLSGTGRYQVQVSETSPNVLAIAPGATITVPPIAPEQLNAGGTARLGLKAPAEPGSYELREVLVGVANQPRLMVVVSRTGSC